MIRGLFHHTKPGRRHVGSSVDYLLQSHRPASLCNTASHINQSNHNSSRSFPITLVLQEATFFPSTISNPFGKSFFASSHCHWLSLFQKQSFVSRIDSPSFVVKRTYSEGKRLKESIKEEGETISGKMAEGGKQDEINGEVKYPAVDTYGPVTIKGCDLVPGKKMKWCTCGLSKKAPWCDGAHKKTGFKSLKWEVPEKPQTVYQICNCQYTKSPPFCDGTHINLPEEVLARQKNCANKPNHEQCLKMCTGCGWKVDF